MNDIENIQNQIIELQNQITTLQEQFNNLKKGYYDWDNAPTIVEINGFKWLLGPEAPNELNWDDAMEWCKCVGGELPPRDILLLSYMKEEIKKEFAAAYCWSSTEFSATDAWSQDFNYGLQDYVDKTYSYYVRAVKKLQIY